MVADLLQSMKFFFFSVKTLPLLSFLRLHQQLHNQIANVDSLPIPKASGGLHRTRCFGGLQFAQICVECVLWSAFSLRWKCGSTMVFSVGGASFCSTSVSVFRASFGLELEYDDSELLLYFFDVLQRVDWGMFWCTF
jgi:hypothetical protein